MSLRLSKEHGLNPSLLVCPICGKDIGVALLGANGGKKAPYQMTSMELCDDCKQIVAPYFKNTEEKEIKIQLNDKYLYKYETISSREEYNS